MERNPEQIRRDIELTRENIARSLTGLQQSVSEATDWKTWVRRRPLASCAAVFGVGFFLGAL